MEGKQLSETTAFQATIGKSAECTAIVKKAVALAVAAVTDFHKKTGFDHVDSHPGNILFDDNVTKANLIDFGLAFKGDLVSSFKVASPLGLQSLIHICSVNPSPPQRT